MNSKQSPQEAVKKFHLHLISDSTGDTIHSVARACIAQFGNVYPIKHVWNLLRTERQMKKALESVQENPGLVLFTVVDEELREFLKRYCRDHDIPAIPVLEPILHAFSAYLERPSLSQPGRQHRLNEAYFERIDAMDYVLQNDDGQSTKNLNAADVILVGVSRTSKTPTCIYLGNRGIKAANIPFIPGVTNEDELRAIRGPLVIGLTESPKRLVDIRKNRMDSLDQKDVSPYTTLEEVEQEVRTARRFYSEMRWPVIDVTKRSVEETAAEIIKLLNRKREKEQKWLEQ